MTAELNIDTLWEIHGVVKNAGSIRLAHKIADAIAGRATPGQARAEVPEEWKLVPVEPTPEMQQAGHDTPGAHMYNAS